MDPTLKNGSIHVVLLTTYMFKHPDRGDMVAVGMPGRRAYYVKRVLGLPGENISFRNGQLIIDGRELTETYLNDIGRWQLSSMDIPEGYYFIAGDNRRTEFSDHTLGFVSSRDIVGKLIPLMK